MGHGKSKIHPTCILINNTTSVPINIKTNDEKIYHVIEHNSQFITIPVPGIIVIEYANKVLDKIYNSRITIEDAIVKIKEKTKCIIIQLTWVPRTDTKMEYAFRMEQQC